MAVAHSVGLRNWVLTTGAKTAWDADGKIDIYTGAPPANPDAAATGTLLGTLTLAATGFGAPSGGVITAAAIASDTSADASGTAGWFRLYKAIDGAAAASGNVPGSATVTTFRRIDGTVAVSGADMNFSGGVAFALGGTIAISSMTITAPV